MATPVTNMDIFPTLCDLCNLPEPAGLEGRSLLPVMAGAEDGQDRCAISKNFLDHYAGRKIRTTKWKYFFYTNGDEYLNDLQADPGGERNLITDPSFRKTANESKQRAIEGRAKLNRM